jgi:serine/threonine-protein kinase
MTVGIPSRIGKFDVIEVLGRGGMGIVYKGRDPSIGRPVAIKMTLGYAHDPELLNRFYREAQSAGKLQHPNIVTIYDLGEQDGNPYMVMEYIEGESLESIINARKGLLLEQKISIAIQLCDALGYAHRHNVIHRDIKPANVMVVPKDFTIKIVDFGIARIGNENVTRPGQLMGSVPYMSPEQIKDKAYVDSRTDVFSAGVLLYQLLTNALPFDGSDMGAILLKIIHESPPPLSRYLESYPPELDRILQTAMAKNLEQRYPTAERFAFDLTRVQDQLKREKVSGYLQVIETLCASDQWGEAREQILQLLRIDSQHPRGNELLSVVERQLLLQKCSEQAQQLRSLAEQALSRNDLGEALNYLDRAVELQSDNQSLTALRNSVAEQKTRADQVFTLLHRAESARETGELETAQKAVDDALRIDPQNREALGLRTLVATDLAEQNKQRQVQSYVDEARKCISSRGFTGALELLKQAEALSPTAPGVRELLKLALSGQEQEIRRKQLEAFNAEIQDALNHDDFASACAKADVALQTFPEDRSLLKLKKLAERQQQASEKRAFIEERIGAARQALDSPEPRQAVSIVQGALQRYPGEPALISMMSVVDESLRRRDEERRKADAVQEAKEAIRNRRYQEAVEILQATRNRISLTDVDELDELVQFAQDEAANYAVKQKVEAVAAQASGLISAGEYQKAIDLLQLTLIDYVDEELQIILEDAQRRLHELSELLRETIGTGKRLLRQNRYAEAIKFLETQSEQCRKSQEFNELLDGARRDYARVQTFSAAKEKVREALSNENFAAAATALEDFQKEFGDISEAVLLKKEIDAARSRTAAVAMEQALSDVRVLLMVRSFDSAENIIESVSQWQPYAPAEMQQQYQSFRSLLATLQEQTRARDLKEKPDQPLTGNQEIAGPDEELAEGGADATERLSISKLHTVLGQVTQIEQHYPENIKIKSAIEELRSRLTVRLDELESTPQEPSRSSLTQLDSQKALEEEEPSRTDVEAEQRAREQKVIEAANELREKQDFQQALSLLDRELEQIPHSAILLQARESLLAAQRRSERLSEAENLRRAGEFTAALAFLKGKFEESDAEAEALLAAVEADEQARRQKALAQILSEARGLISAGQLSQAIEKLRQSLAQYPGQSEVLALLRSTEKELQTEHDISSVRTRADALIAQGNYDKAIALGNQNAQRGAKFEALLASIRESAEKKRREDILTKVTNLQSSGRYKEALKMVERASALYEADAAVADLESTLRKQVGEESRKEARDTDLKRLLKTEQQFSRGKSPASTTLQQDVDAIASAYPFDDEIASIAARIHAKVESAAVLESSARSVSKSPDVNRSSPSQVSGIPPPGAADSKPLSPRESLHKSAPPSPDRIAIKPRFQPGAQPAVLVTCALGLTAILGVTVYVWKANSRPAPVAVTHSAVTPSQQADPVQAQQQAAIDAADKLVAAGDLAGAQKELQAAPPHGALDAIIQRRRAGIKAATQDQSLGALRQKEEQLWQQATGQVNKGEFASAKSAFQQILGLGEGGARKAEARQYLDQTIPQRETEQRLFQQAMQESKQTSLSDLQNASSLLDQVIALNGPRKSDATMLRAKVSDRINHMQNQQRDQRIATLQADVAQHMQKGDFIAARQDAQTIKNLGGDAASLSAQIDQAEKTQIADNVFHQAQQGAEVALKSGDRDQLGASRNELQRIQQSGGPHAKEASDLSDQVTKKLSALSQPSVPKAPVSPNTNSSPSTADEGAVQEALERFNTAFRSGKPREVKSIWPSVDKKYTDAMRAAGGYSFAFALQQQGAIRIEGNSAVVSCALVSMTSRPDGKADQSKKSVKVTLGKAGNSWVILDPLTPNQ